MNFAQIIKQRKSYWLRNSGNINGHREKTLSVIARYIITSIPCLDETLKSRKCRVRTKYSYLRPVEISSMKARSISNHQNSVGWINCFQKLAEVMYFQIEIDSPTELLTAFHSGRQERTLAAAGSRCQELVLFPISYLST